MQGPEGVNSPSTSAYYSVPFSIVSENWSSYAFEDGNKLRGRVILVSLKSSQLPIRKGVVMNTETQVIIKADVPPNRRGPPGHPALPEEVSDPLNHGGLEVSVIGSSEPWNEYAFDESGKIKLKFVLNKVWRLKDRYDSVGDPVYVTNFIVVNNLELT